MANLLICDDEAGLRSVLKRYALFEGHTVTEAENGLEAIELCRKNTFDLLIIDIMMPELDGFSAVKEIRKSSGIPILILSALGEEYDKVLGFELGIDDYVVKPFSSKEIMMRIEAILRRATKKESISHHEIFEKEGLKVDMTAYKVFVDNMQVDMATKEYELLFYLIRHKNKALQREHMLTSVWGTDFYGDHRTLDTHIKLLRKSLGFYGAYIVTIRGLGYRFDG